MIREFLKSPLLPEALGLVQKISGFRSEWTYLADTERDFYTSLRKTVIVTSAGASTRIEGARLSDEEILKKLRGLKMNRIRDRDEAEVAGYIDAKKYIFEHYSELEISEHTIRSLHQMMMSYLPESVFPLAQRGAYKNVPNSVIRIDHETGEREILFETTPPGPQTETAMREAVEDYRNYIDSPNYSDLEVIAAFIVQFLAIHPFRDGNGRISRLLSDLCLLRQGYDFCMYSSHEKIIEDSKDQYYVALRQAQATLKAKADLNPWFLYFLRVLDRQTQFLSDKLEPRKPGSLTRLEQQVFDLVREHQPVTIGFLERESGMKRVTLKSILARLKDRGTLSMEGERKASRYRLR
jgi:Fic family protein